jgi:Ca-activated chloride channel homolog
MPPEFHWLRPEWLLAVPPIGAFAWFMARRRLSPGSWRRVVDSGLLPHVLSRAPRSGTDYRWWLVFAGGTLAALSLAGPSWNRIEQPVHRSEQAIVIALDLSRSMDAEDVTPSRLSRAKLKIQDILAERTSGQTALLVYSSNAFTVTPLTTDTDTIAALVASLTTDIMPSQGSNPVAAIDKGRQLLEQAGVNDGRILLITDGGASAAANRAAEELEEQGHSLSILGVGTQDGAPIPDAGGGFVTDRRGQIAVPKLERKGLESLAEAGGGRFAVMTTDSGDIGSLLPGDFSRAGNYRRDDGDLATDQWREEGPWLLLLVLPLAALAFRRGWVFAVLFFVVPLPAPAHAFEWRDLWRTGDQQARQELAAGNAEEAAALFEDPEWRGIAQYRAGNFSESAAAFRERDDADGQYNLGNALARQGRFEPAIAAYDRALAIDPDAEDARYNRGLVKELLERQKAQGGEGGEQSRPGERGQSNMQESGKPSDQAGEEGGTGDPEAADQGASPESDEETMQEDLEAMRQELERAARASEQEDGASGDRTDPAMLAAARREQERQQALEQWLRRIPDDPGGLLRRKFRYQYQRQGVDQDGNSLWSERAVNPW